MLDGAKEESGSSDTEYTDSEEDTGDVNQLLLCKAAKLLFGASACNEH